MNKALRHTRTVVVVGATLVAASLVAAGVPAVAQPTAATTSGRTVQLVGHPNGGGGVDAAPKGPSLGDEFFESGTLSDRNGHPLGTFTISGQLVGGSPDAGFEHAESILYLGGGTIVVSGGHRTVEQFAMPVAGGTGRYEGARGSAAFAPGANGTERVDVHLLN